MYKDYSKQDIRKFSKFFVEFDKEVCWFWTGGMNSNGYGVFQSKLAHIVSYEIFNATDAPRGEVICHKCDNRRCINPHHLYSGTRKDNAFDRRLDEKAKKLLVGFMDRGSQYKEVPLRRYLKGFYGTS